MNIPSYFNVRFVADLIVEFVLTQDGVFIEDFINNHTEHKADYLEDSLWNIDGKTCCSGDVKTKLNDRFDEMDAKDIVRIYQQEMSNHTASLGRFLRPFSFLTCFKNQYEESGNAKK